MVFSPSFMFLITMNRCEIYLQWNHLMHLILHRRGRSIILCNFDLIIVEIINLLVLVCVSLLIKCAIVLIRILFFYLCCSDVDATTLACLAFSCPSLKTLEITMAGNAVNRMTGYVVLGYNLNE